MRVLFLATYFPKPDNPVMGVWALREAQALVRAGVELDTVSLTPWVPRALAGASERLRPWAACPPEHTWGEVHVEYPRWPLYHVGPHKRMTRRWPLLELEPGWLGSRRALRELARRQRPDVIYAHGTSVSGYVAMRLADELGVPFVTADFDFDEVADCWRYPARRRLYREVGERAAAVLPVSRRMEADLRALVPGARLRTLHLGADPVPAARFERPRPPELKGRLVVFSAATFYGRKALPLLIEAFARVAPRHPDAVLRLAGDGPERPAVDAAVARASLGERIQLLGLRPHEEVLQEMAWADVFALIGWDEPFATVYMEAMAAANPVLCANDGGVVDVLEDGVQGRAVPPRDVPAAASALDSLLADGAARERMGAAARSLVESSLTWDARAVAAVSVFEAALR